MENDGTVMTGNENGSSRAERLKLVAAWILLSLPLFAHPLFWVRFFRTRLVYWNHVTLITLPVLALAAVAVLLLTGFRDLRRQCAGYRLNLLVAVFSAVLVVQSLARWAYTGGRLEFEDWYLPLLPLAGMALSREIMRILPRWGTIVLAVLIVFTLRFPEYCIGLPGNWNWNLSLLAVLIPAPFLLRRLVPKRFWIPVLAAAVFLGVFSLLKPKLAPFGVIVGVTTASAALWLLWKLPRRQRLFITILGGGAGIAMFLTIWLGPADSANRDSRFWLWRGSVELALRKGAFGVGSGNYEREIDQHLPKEYYFSEYPANLHTHPHNELLAAWCSYGVAGVIFIMVFTLAVVSGLRNYSAVRVWGFWLFLVLSVHGQVDVLLQTPLAGTLWLVVGGALAGDGRRSREAHPRWGFVGAVAAAALAAVVFLASWFYRESLLSYEEGDGYISRRKAEKSLALREMPATRYLAGGIELRLLHNYRGAIRHYERLAPGYLHSNLYMGCSYAALGEYDAALSCFDLESRAFPMSALNAYMKLEVMRKTIGEDDEVSLASQKAELHYLLKLRGISVDELLKNHDLDDRSKLKNP